MRKEMESFQKELCVRGTISTENFGKRPLVYIIDSSPVYVGLAQQKSIILSET